MAIFNSKLLVPEGNGKIDGMSGSDSSWGSASEEPHQAVLLLQAALGIWEPLEQFLDQAVEMGIGHLGTIIQFGGTDFDRFW